MKGFYMKQKEVAKILYGEYHESIRSEYPQILVAWCCLLKPEQNAWVKVAKTVQQWQADDLETKQS